MVDKFTGVGVALITPFKEDLSIDFDGLEKLIHHVNQGEVDYLVVNGTTGEASTIGIEEKASVLEFVAQHNVKKLPILYGIGANDTEFVKQLIDHTNFDYVDAVLTVTPYYNKPSQFGIRRHYNIIADASPKPVLLYNVPGRTGVNMESETTLLLAEHPNIFGIKEASGDFLQFMDIMRHKPDDFLLISGDDLLTVPMISIGAVGVISVLANAFPKMFSDSVHNALDGNYQKAREKLFPFVNINSLLYAESNPVGIKEVLRQKNICEGYVRPPLMEASQVLCNQIHTEYKTIQEFN
jgi:4-hydroxy-tetrahydrodipicolinate synthase